MLHVLKVSAISDASSATGDFWSCFISWPPRFPEAFTFSDSANPRKTFKCFMTLNRSLLSPTILLVLAPEPHTGERIPQPMPKFLGSNQIPDPVKIFIVFPIPPWSYFGQISDPENTLPDPQWCVRSTELKFIFWNCEFQSSLIFCWFSVSSTMQILLLVWIYIYFVGSWWRRWTSIRSVHVKRYTSQKNSGWCDNGENSGQEDRNRVADVWYIMLCILSNRCIKYKAASGQDGAVLYLKALRFIEFI